MCVNGCYGGATGAPLSWVVGGCVAALPTSVYACGILPPQLHIQWWCLRMNQRGQVEFDPVNDEPDAVAVANAVSIVFPVGVHFDRDG